MVYFTCNHCGESLKKKGIDKHYHTNCRNLKIFVTCVDCQKDFRDQEFQLHTKCISEEEKYSGQDYKPKANQNKGEKMQQKWTAMLQDIVKTKTGISKKERDLLQTLTKYENVPMKHNKFQNFMANALRNRFSEETVQKVWVLLEAARKSLKENETQSRTNENGNFSTKSEDINGHQENGESIEENGTGNDKKLSKKQKKERRKSESGNRDVTLEDASLNLEDTTTLGEETTGGKENENLSKKQKKEKKKREKYEAELEALGKTEILMEEANDEDEEKLSKKKRKKSKKCSEEIVTNENEEHSVEEEQKKKKKGKKRHQEGDMEDASTAKKVKGDESFGVTAGPNTPFKWHKTIVRVLEGAPDKKMPVKKLKRKVMALYAECGSDPRDKDNIYKAQAKFHKKLITHPSVDLTHGMAKLIKQDE